MINLQVLGFAASDNAGSTNMSLPVALHSPLEVLKAQLEDITGISPQDQVLILCDLTDVERNNDILLSENNSSLSECGIRHGSTLTLHPLGMPAEIRRSLLKPIVDKRNAKEARPELSISLSTPITAAQADHSYNGVIFDVISKGPYELSITSISVGGMLGLVVSYLYF